MSIRLLPLHTWRWWHRPLIGRFGLKSGNRHVGYAQGVRWAFRVGPITVTRWASCTCT